VTEGTGRTRAARFDVSLSAPNTASSPLVLTFDTADGSATAPADYTAMSSHLTFQTGQQEKTISIAVNGDTG